MTPGLVMLVAAVVAAVLFGLWRRRSDGRFRVTPGPAEPPRAARDDLPAASPVASPAAELVRASGVGLGERATLVQFSSAFCAPCRTTRVVLSDVAAAVPGVVHVDVDAESHLDVVRLLGVMRTPTTVVLDAAGREVSRASGAPTRDQVLVAVDTAASHHTDGDVTS